MTGVAHLHVGDGTIDAPKGDALVDGLLYFATNKDVWAAHLDPAGHDATSGWKEGRDPSPGFSTKGYLAANPDVAAAGIDPMQHSLSYGAAEHRVGWVIA